ncbi:hypothetical protein D7D52_37085 [Nocardia yunnanensis]|uniref:Thymidylate synthase n=1 Tax=Nocardia yunnanensis TaxID=2382165 RepID=A0A386ZLM3_9NOCA|nr:hypothetical protein [Nocardia yunnanensis]AYF78517.1 hypothetical protein D7D52_37085 [Nocardia yunnanensis]
MSHPIHVHAPDLSTAWLQTTLAVHAAPGRRALHTVTHIVDAAKVEQPRIRAAADDLLDEIDLQPVDTVANTIFPAALALQTSNPAELAERYRRLYPSLKRLERRNNRGTYFLRLVAYPAEKGPVDQLGHLIDTLIMERANAAPKRARYETSLHVPDTEISVPIFEPGRDTTAMAFPCLSLLSFQLDGEHLHAVAHYRSQYLVARGYGNYMGICRLLGYVAAQVGVGIGAVTVVVGQAHADHLRRDLTEGLHALAADLALI